MQLDLATVLNTMGVGVFVCDRDGTMLVANDAALKICGVKSVEQLRGHPLHAPRFADGQPIPREARPFPRALAGEEVVFEMELFDDDTRGTVVLRTRTAPMRDAAGVIVGAVKVAVDVSKEYELAQVKDEFVRQAAHQLKTPISIIKANAETVVASQSKPTEQQMQGLIRSSRGGRPPPYKGGAPHPYQLDTGAHPG